MAEEFRVIVGQDWHDIGGELVWSLPANLPPVLATRQGLLQTLLNLSQNSLRAVENAGTKRLTLDASTINDHVLLRVCDTGPGLKTEQNLFQPFRKEADGSGLGLYVSRALIESFGGELRYQPTEIGCCFIIKLRAAGDGYATIPAPDLQTESERTHA
jgi:C4-dicarboxylate-specific signal transduction histidine kinase